MQNARVDHTAAVTLRELRDEDLDALFQWMRDPVAVRMAAFTDSDPDDRAAFDLKQARLRSDPDIAYVAVDRDGELVGTVATFTLDGERELTYWIAREHWGQGCATAAVAAILRADRTRPMVARVASANVGSLRVLEKSGFVGVGRETSYADGVSDEIEETILRLD